MLKNKSFLIVGLLILLFSLVWNYRQYQDRKAQRQRIEAISQSTYSGNAKVVKVYVHDTIPHTVIQEVPVRSDAEKRLTVGAGYTDTVVKALNIALNKIDELTKTNAVLSAKVQLKDIAVVPVINADTPRLPDLKSYSDKYLALVYNPLNDSVQLTYNVSLNAAKYWKRSWLLSPKSYYIDFWSDDPRVNISGAKRYSTEVFNKPKKWGVGFSGGYGYIPALNKGFPYVGASLNYNLFQF